ncbi:MAG: lysylphosphatidylglycerol synthase domain-containing protein [Cyanobacteria bacterium P01_A01_bin.135]
MLKRLKPFVRWAILGGTLFFLVQAVKGHWQEVAALRLGATGWRWLGVALAVTLVAHVWTGWVWGWILGALAQPARAGWSTLVYLKTNIAKYLPGNVWHFYGRVMAAKAANIPVAASVVSVVLEALLMAIAALMVALLGSQYGLLQWAGLLLGLGLVHPRLLNPVLRRLARSKGRSLSAIGAAKSSPATGMSAEPGKAQANTAPVLARYPVKPLLGELVFLLLRGAGFLAAVRAFAPLPLVDLPVLLSGFSLAWMLGLVIPGAPGGIGVFEATALALLEPVLPAAELLGAIAVYRLVSTVAEAIGAGVAGLMLRNGDGT